MNNDDPLVWAQEINEEALRRTSERIITDWNCFIIWMAIAAFVLLCDFLKIRWQLMQRFVSFEIHVKGYSIDC